MTSPLLVDLASSFCTAICCSFGYECCCPFYIEAALLVCYKVDSGGWLSFESLSGESNKRLPRFAWKLRVYFVLKCFFTIGTFKLVILLRHFNKNCLKFYNFTFYKLTKNELNL